MIDATLADELVAANRILAKRGVVDGFGHVSVRDPADAGHFLIARSMAPALVSRDDLMRIDLDGVPGDDRPAYLERFIHAAIYRMRDDVQAVVHSHSVSVIPFGVVAGVPLRPIYHMSGFLGRGAPVFEIRDACGDASDMLIRTLALGRALAESLGRESAVLMRGHGSTVVGGSLPQAVFRAVYLEVNAAVQMQALQLGPVNYLTPAEAAAAAASNDGQIGRTWALWRRELG